MHAANAISAILWLLAFDVVILMNIEPSLQIESQIDEFVGNLMDLNNIPGFNLAIVNNGEEYLTKGYGYARMTNESTVPVTNRTLFYIASTTKAFTGTLLAKLLSEHDNYNLDTPVKEILGDRFHLADYARGQEVTSRDLLAHRVAVPTSDFTWIMGDVTTRQELTGRAYLYDYTELFRSEYVYSNMMYTIAGEVVETLTGSSWEDAVRQHLFAPLAMTSSTFFDHLSSDELDNLARTYFYNDDGSGELKEVSLEVLATSGPAGPSGSICSNAVDMIKWLLLQVSEGRAADGTQVVEPEVMAEIHDRHMPGYPPNLAYVKPNTPETYVEDGYGLGWYIGFYRGYRMVTHLGSIFGYYSRITVLPDLGIAVYSNANGPDPTPTFDAHWRIHIYTIDLLLGETPWVNDTYPPPSAMEVNFGDPALANEKTMKLLSDVVEYVAIRDSKGKSLQKRHLLQEYEGVYGHFGIGNVSIYYDSAEDALTGDYGQTGFFTLTPLNLQQHLFSVKTNDPFWFLPASPAFFDEDIDGNIVSVTVPVMLLQDWPMFVKDLDIADKPLPPTDECSSKTLL